MSISDIEQWIDNDEGLYNWWRGSRVGKLSKLGFRIGSRRMTKREFIKENHAEIEAAINNVLHGKKPAHYLAYGG